MTLNIETVSAVNPLKTDTEKKEKVRAFFRQRQSKLSVIMRSQKGGGGVLGLMFTGYVPMASQSPYPIIVYFLANYRPHLSHFLENVIFAIPT